MLAWDLSNRASDLQTLPPALENFDFADQATPQFLQQFNGVEQGGGVVVLMLHYPYRQKPIRVMITVGDCCEIAERLQDCRNDSFPKSLLAQGYFLFSNSLSHFPFTTYMASVRRTVSSPTTCHTVTWCIGRQVHRQIIRLA